MGKIDYVTPLQKDQELLKLASQKADPNEDYEEQLKRSLFENNSQKTVVIEEEEEEEYTTNKQFAHQKRPGEKWDVPITEKVEYFDPELSYEITGYRPITMDDGLDFDPAPFQQAGEVYDRTGAYTEYPKGCKPYVNFWDEQKLRCNEGYTVGRYRVTGDHYFFLNFYRMQTPKLDDLNSKTGGRDESFPSFSAKQYEFFHYWEMCERLGFDVVMLKGRGLGFSEILSNQAVRPFMTRKKKFRTVCTAAADNQLDPLLDKCWFQLNWLNMNTNGGMHRSRQKIDNLKQKRASLVNKENIEYGIGSEIEGIVADNPRKIRGDRCERLIFEEAGSNSNLIKSWVQGRSLVELNGMKIGIMVAGGTGGDSGAPLMGLSKMFWNPRGYNVLPFKHSYTRDGKPALTGYFLPAHTFALNPKYIDHRGVTDSEAFRKYYEDKWALMDDVKDRMMDMAEHCLTPEDALIQAGDNLFDAVALSERLTQIKIKKDYIKPRPMHLLWDNTFGNGKEKVTSTEVASSPLLVVEPPRVDDSGRPYKNLYVAGIDSIDMGKKDSASDYDVSDFCIVIKRRVFGMEDPRYVAIYKDRPDDIRQAYDVAMKLLVWYNCQAMLEYTKISIQTYFRDRKKDYLFLSRPEYAVGTTSRPQAKNRRLIGVSGTEAVIRHGLELIAGFVTDYWHTLDFEDVIDQLLNYSFEMKRKFDVVAAMQMAEIGDESLSSIPPTQTKPKNKEWEDIGYYRDARGVKHWGVIPKK